MIQTKILPCLLLTLLYFLPILSIEVGIDRLFQPEFLHLVEGKKVGVVTNHTGVSSSYVKTEHIFVEENKKGTCTLVCFFCPEHGFRGTEMAEVSVENQIHECGVPIYSLHGTTRRPTDTMLKGIDVIVFDLQDIGCRSYTYASTLFYLMEEAARKDIDVVVLDRPNPLGGEYVEGPMMEDAWRSFVGYINVPYCHGMTMGELALFFQKEHHVQCPLHIVPMKGWKRSMRFCDTGLIWIPPSPHIPNEMSAYFYPSTGILGAISSFINIGIGYTLPFQIVTAPWLEAKRFATHLNKAKLPGVHFHETWMRPFWGPWKDTICQGVQIIITDKRQYCPMKTFYLIMSTLRELYPSKTLAALKKLPTDSLFHKASGTKEIMKILQQEEHPYHVLVELHKEERRTFIQKRSLYLIKEY